MKIGKQLQKQRKLNQMSQDDLAKELNISRQSISKWENGATLPSFSNVVAISEIFDISLDELIKGDTELMQDLESNKSKISKTWLIIIMGFILAVVVTGALRLLHVSDDNMDNWFFIPELIAFVWLMFNINWKKINLSINRKVLVIGIIWLALYLIPRVNEAIAGFIHGFSSSIR
ncbi:helix-turn-helix domain-containing protein [Companilactobacillus kimchiensis]|uniref:HTH cro/C1-type domain-containing protein n=1 Tax=Companilactobacillus kimchiensis TaxID=993692 RepID=A0A0R2LJY9_9LACO|nr:helix-turn-helix transcriptional regulator [Companilactobacillus kimchiensis]KRN98893.1 hypothetical protein IV57_GL000703 [Companilactobacillus kimchiensis]